MAKAWWRKRLLRIYHPDAREGEFRELNVSGLIADCLAMQAEAVVIRAGGIYALYPSRVPYHEIIPAIGQRDLLGEIVSAAHARSLRVIAEVDFSRAREEVWLTHPEWFQRLASGEVARDGAYYLTCPLGGYQNADFALPVLREISSRYGVDGFLLKTVGFAGYCYCDTCVAAFGGPIPTGPSQDSWEQFLRWRMQAVANQLASYHGTITELNPESIFVAELVGPQDPVRAHKAAQYLPALARSFSHLVITVGDPVSARSSRWWVGLAADLARAVRRKRSPVINIARHDPSFPRASMPPAEFAFYSYQALAHGAGIKATTTGLPSSQSDPRTMPILVEPFRFMREQDEVLEGMMPIYDVGLIWPETAFHRASCQEATDGLRGECLGLYAALKAKHILVGLLYDEFITAKRLRNFGVIVLPTAVWLSGEAIEALTSYVLEGGRLVLLDSPSVSPDPGFLPMPEALAELIGTEVGVEARIAPYMLPTAQLPPGPQIEKRKSRPLPRTLSEIIHYNWTREAAQDGLLGVRLGRGLGPVPLTLPYRRIKEKDGTHVWLRSARLQEAIRPVESNTAEIGEDPLLLVALAGQGLIIYAATGLGQMYLETGYEDYATILEAMISHGSTIKPYLLTDAPSSVEVTMAHWKLGVVVHLVNAAGPVPLDAPAPVGPIELDLAWDGPAVAHLCAPGAAPQVLRCHEEWNRVRITVPRLNAYAQVVVRSG